MLKKLSLTLILLILFAVNLTFAQSKEGWNIYTSFKEVKGVGVSGNTVWGASSGGLFYFDISSPFSTSEFTTLQGLLSNQLTSVFVDNLGNIWSGASDGAINVYYPAGKNFRVISDILNSTESIKNINGFFQYANYLFIASEFSIIKFDINRFELVDQPYIYLGPLVPVKTPVYENIVVNDTIWAATKNGIAFANINNDLPIQSNWSNYTTTNSALQKNKTNTVVYFDNKIFFGTDSMMFYHSNSGLTPFTPLYNGVPVTDRISHMAVSNGSLYFSTYMNSNNIFKVSSSNLNSAELVYSGLEVNSLKVNSNGDLLVGTLSKGIAIIRNGNITISNPNAPNSNLFIYVAVDINSNVWGVSGGINEGIYRYNGNTWKNFTTEQYPNMKGNDYRQVYCERNSSTVWASGYGEGLLKIMGDSVYLFDDGNSCLDFFISPGFVLIEGVKEDNFGNLWVINRATTTPFVNFTTCEKYPVPENPISEHHDISCNR